MPGLKRGYSTVGVGATIKKAKKPNKTRRRGRVESDNHIAQIAQRVVDRNVEWKYHDVSANTTIDDTGAATCLSHVSQGDSTVTRTGDRLRATSIAVTDIVIAVKTNQTTLVRVIYFQWMDDTTNSPPTVAAVLEDTNTRSAISHDYRNRMRVLNDTLYDIDPTSQRSMVMRNKFRIPEQQIQYAGGTTQHFGGVWRVVLSNQSGADAPAYQTFVRMNFSDA